MQGYNNYGGYGSQFGNNLGMMGAAGGNFRPAPATGAGMMYSGTGGFQGPQPAPAQEERVYVNGRVGADAYQLPNGVFKQTLWDTTAKRFFVKGYDNNGMPRVLEDNDYSEHIEPEPVQQKPIDLTPYATKDDIRMMIAEAFNNIRFPNMSEYVTQKDLLQTISELSVGNGGRIVRSNGTNE